MVELTRRGLSARAASHNEDLDGSFLIDSGILVLQPGVKAAEVQSIEAVQGGVVTEVDVTGSPFFGSVRAMGPGTDDDLDRTLLRTAEGTVGLQGGASVGIVPTTHEKDRNI